MPKRIYSLWCTLKRWVFVIQRKAQWKKWGSWGNECWVFEISISLGTASSRTLPCITHCLQASLTQKSHHGNRVCQSTSITLVQIDPFITGETSSFSCAHYGTGIICQDWCNTPVPEELLSVLGWTSSPAPNLTAQLPVRIISDIKSFVFFLFCFFFPWPGSDCVNEPKLTHHIECMHGIRGC